MKVLTVVGARPQFIKAGIVSRAIRQCSKINEILLHTGQHFDSNMSDIFFNQLALPKPDVQLDISGGSHGEMTGRMLSDIERVLIDKKPDRVLVYGDTNSTLAGALAASKLHIPVAHVEAGLRSFNMRMPEEINRILTDQVSDLLFCPTDIAVKNLCNEGFEGKSAKVLQVGDVMQDATLFFAEKACPPKNVVLSDEYILATLHRAENTDSPERLASLVDALNEVHRNHAEVVLPIHPRTRKALEVNGLNLDVNIIDPVGYLEMIWLLNNSQLVLTDSGGVQKEAFFFGKACVTMRDQTEWLELIDVGANELVGADKEKVLSSVSRNYGRIIVDDDCIYGGGKASKLIVNALV